MMTTVTEGGGAEGEGRNGLASNIIVGDKARKLSPYFSFSKQNREKVKAQLVAAGGNTSASSISKALGALWRSMSDTEREAFSCNPSVDAVLPSDGARIKFDDTSTSISNSSAKILSADKGLLQVEGTHKVAENMDQSIVKEALVCDESNLAAENCPAVEALPPFPLSRVKKIIRLDTDIKVISSDGVSAITKATQLFLETLASASFSCMLKSKHKTIRLPEVEMAVKSTKNIYEFIGESLRSSTRGIQEVEENNEEQDEDVGIREEDADSLKRAKVDKKIVLPPPPGSRCITDFFNK